MNDSPRFRKLVDEFVRTLHRESPGSNGLDDEGIRAILAFTLMAYSGYRRLDPERLDQTTLQAGIDRLARALNCWHRLQQYRSLER